MPKQQPWKDHVFKLEQLKLFLENPTSNDTRIAGVQGIARLVIENIPIMKSRERSAQLIREDLKNPIVREAVIRALAIRRESVAKEFRNKKRIEHSRITFPHRPTTGRSKPPQRRKPPATH